jgi:hypothetical protein
LSSVRLQLLKVRNGKPGSWRMEWVGQLRDISRVAAPVQEQRKKAGLIWLPVEKGSKGPYFNNKKSTYESTLFTLAISY